MLFIYVEMHILGGVCGEKYAIKNVHEKTHEKSV